MIADVIKEWLQDTLGPAADLVEEDANGNLSIIVDDYKCTLVIQDADLVA